MGKFVDVVNSRGEEQRVPEHWLDHPVLGAKFRTPPDVTEETPDGDVVPVDPNTPTEAWTIPDLVKFAEQHDIDLDGATRKGEILTALSGKA